MNKHLETAETLENFIIYDNMIKNGKGYYYENKNVLGYYNTGYEHFYSAPDWEKVRLEIIEHYDWVKTDDDLLEAVSDAISNYSLFSRG